MEMGALQHKLIRGLNKRWQDEEGRACGKRVIKLDPFFFITFKICCQMRNVYHNFKKVFPYLQIANIIPLSIRYPVSV